ncbi:MAG: hypothetical protein L3K15_08795 [Thermoplasmata archaeon]|nr:hypothetical protein [Thermoplasmata archaeon]
MFARSAGGLDAIAPTLPDVGPTPIPFFPRPTPTRPTTVRRAIPRAARAPARRLLPAHLPLFDWLEKRFAPGEATLWVGASSALEPMLEMLYAGSALAGGNLSLIEGANRFHPYRIAEAGRGVGTDPEAVLDRIRLARAFTAYQLVALVDGWAKELHRAPATLLVGHDLPTLFFNEDELPADERVPLLRHVAATLSEVVRTSRRPLLLTLPGGLAQFPGLPEYGPRLFDLVRIEATDRAVELSAYRDGSRLSLVARGPNQVGLEAFAPTEPKEVIAPWGAPRQRTAKRWKSG